MNKLLAITIFFLAISQLTIVFADEKEPQGSVISNQNNGNNGNNGNPQNRKHNKRKHNHAE